MWGLEWEQASSTFFVWSQWRHITQHTAMDYVQGSVWDYSNNLSSLQKATIHGTWVLYKSENC